VQTPFLCACFLFEKTGYHKSKLATFSEQPDVTGYRCVCLLRAPLSALFHCHRPVAFTGAAHALQALSAPAKPYTKSCAGWFKLATAAQTLSCASHYPSDMFAGTNRSETSVEALVEASCFHGQGPTYARQRCCQWTEQA